MNKKIACVNLVRVINESPVGNLEMARSLKVKEILVSAEMAAQNIYLTMTEDEVQKNRAADMKKINQSWVIEQQNARMVSLSVIAKETEQYRDLNGLDIILNSECIIALDKKYDVTDDIILRLKDVQIDYGNLPTFKVAEQEDIHEESSDE